MIRALLMLLAGIACAAEVVDASAALQPAAFAEVTAWTAHYEDGAVIESCEADGGGAGLRLRGKAGPEKRTYAAIERRFPAAIDARAFTGLSFTARASRTVQPMVTITCAGGSLSTGWMPALTTGWARIDVPRAKFTAKGSPDLGRISAITLAFGLWGQDTTQDGFTAEVAAIAWRGPEVACLIARPDRSVAVDGAFRDWGSEDVLYNWTPPAWLHLDRQDQVVAGEWSAPAELSARAALMIDDRNLYLLAVVADRTPFQGSSPDAPWTNDALELFLSVDPTPAELAQDMAPRHGAQLIVDCGATRRGAALLFVRGKAVPAEGVATAVVAHRELVDGAERPGYVVEVAVPLKLLGLERQPGQLLACSLTLDDSAGTRLSLTPGNRRPSGSHQGFRRAWVEVEAAATKPLVFAAVAAEPVWPQRYAGSATVPGWAAEHARRDRPDAARERICLNGLWAWQDADSDRSGPDPAAWAYAPVPTGLNWAVPIFDVTTVAGGRAQLKVRGYETSKAKPYHWYERSISVEPGADRWYLTCEYLQDEAAVWVNGRRIGTIDSANTTLEVTSALVAGANRLDLAVYYTIYPGPNAANGKGLSGDVWLERRAREPLIRDVWFKEASGLDGAFTVVIDAESTAGRDLTLELCEPDGRVVASASGHLEGRNATLTGQWKGFRPWSPEHPNLIAWRLRLADGQVLADERRGRTGFRSFRWDGGRFTVNGVPLRIRNAEFVANPSGVVDPDRFAQLKRWGHNGVFMHSANGGHLDPIFERLDEVGLVCFAPVERQLTPARAAAEVKRYRNHPCVIGWITDPFGQLDSNGWMRNPFQPADDFLPDGRIARTEREHLLSREAFFRGLDPTRPYVSHGNGVWPGGIRTDNRYPTSDLNLIDRMLWYRPWAERTRKLTPFHVYEAGVSFLTGTDLVQPEYQQPTPDPKRTTTRLVTREHYARYQGEAAFGTWRQGDAFLTRAHIRGMRIHGLDGFTPWMDDDMFLDPANADVPAKVEDKRQLSWTYFHAPLREVLDHMWMRQNDWYYRLRALARWNWGPAYGHPADQKERSGVYTAIWAHEMQPVFAGLFGPSREVMAREHTAWGGETIERTVIAVNDSEQACDLDCTAELRLGAATVVRQVRLRLAAGEIDRESVTFRVPEVAERTAGTLRLSFTDPAGRPRSEEWPLTAFPRRTDQPWRQAGWNRRVGLVPGPDGLSLARAAGMPVLPAAGFTNLDLVVVERGALRQGFDHAALMAWVAQGGRALILEQDGSGLLGWRLRQRRLESVFPADRAHPALRGLEAGDLSFLRGPAGNVPDTHEPSRFWRNVFAMAMDTPHLSSEGVTAGWVLEKPAYGAAHPILVGGYDLEESALIEVRAGAGSLVLCQVDISGRYGRDPAATVLADNLLAWGAGTPGAGAGTPVRYRGGPVGAALLDRLGVVRTGAEQAGGILVLGEGATVDDALLAGRNAVVPLPGCPWLPAGVQRTLQPLREADNPGWSSSGWYQFTNFTAAWPAPDHLSAQVPAAFAGLVANDLYHFDGPMVPTLSGGDALWRSRFGSLALLRLATGGQLVWNGWDPAVAACDETRRKALRTWSVLFANLGAASSIVPGFSPAAADLSGGEWSLVLDPAGDGEKTGIASGQTAGRDVRPIRIGLPWEEQGVVQANPSLQNDPDTGYNGFAWYLRQVEVPVQLAGRSVHVHVDGVLDAYSFARSQNQTDLYIDGVKQPAPVGIWSGQQGGQGGRLWKLGPGVLKPGGRQLLAIRVYNATAAGGLNRAPVRLEVEGRNDDALLPYEFQRSKLPNYYFWSW